LFPAVLEMPRSWKSRELVDADPINPLGDHDLGVFAVANIAPESASATLPAHSIAGTPSRADARGDRRRTPSLALARFARRAPGQSLSTGHVFCAQTPKISEMSRSEAVKIVQHLMKRIWTR
jgi:hypothetical protein